MSCDALKPYREVQKAFDLANYDELYNHCANCPYYHVNSFEKMKTNLHTTHRCKALSTDHRDEYSRGYYQIMTLGVICPLTKKQITKYNMREFIKLRNSVAFLSTYETCIKDNDNIENKKILQNIITLILRN